MPGVAGPSPVIYSGQPTGPNGAARPLFPSAAASGKSTFPAYGEYVYKNKNWIPFFFLSMCKFVEFSESE